ncbi:helix-turn-helix transcriptional regulator [Streptomyces sp. WAC06614]|uniref:helix-turn-helix domain-containing protein n=1 Tax=Streptomyces sp. WAC06614 TaxID=2487416 RepID=UPI000F7B2235|nr:helix-turn-helix transcriptional regulator [Streptomyces sp. WAC06614]RSS79616.1 XRE family transcriptional regulator [Streptomyces sp. WAC06614]
MVSDDADRAALRNFGQIVKASRNRAGLTQEQLAAQINYSVEALASVEQGRRHPSRRMVTVVDEVLDAFGVILIAWKQLNRRRGLAKWFQHWAELEDQAIALNTYESRSVPGLLQPESYAWALMADALPPPPSEKAEARIAARLQRQEILTRTPHTVFSFIIDEVVVHRQSGGPEVTRELIDHLLECGQLPNADIQIMPLVSPRHSGLGGPFRLLETQEHEWYGYSEGQQLGRVLSDPNDLSALHLRYAKLRIQALNPVDSAGLLKRMRGTL